MPAAIRHSGAALIALPGVLLLAAQAGRVWPPLDLISAALPGLLVAALAALLIALGQRRWRLAALLAAGLAAGALQLGGAIAAAAPASPAPAQLRLLTVNAFHGNQHAAQLARAIAAARPDIILLQESDGAIAALLARELPGFDQVASCARPQPGRGCSLTIVSRWPAARIALEGPAGGGLPDLLAARIAAPGGPIAAISLHLPRPYLALAQRDAALLADAVAAQAGVPTLIAGDFNLPTGSHALTALETSTRLRRLDTFLPTYPANRPFPAILPIDHLLASPEWQSHGCARFVAAGADHWGIMCEISR